MGGPRECVRNHGLFPDRQSAFIISYFLQLWHFVSFLAHLFRCAPPGSCFKEKEARAAFSVRSITDLVDYSFFLLFSCLLHMAARGFICLVAQRRFANIVVRKFSRKLLTLGSLNFNNVSFLNQDFVIHTCSFCILIITFCINKAFIMRHHWVGNCF